MTIFALKAVLISSIVSGLLATLYRAYLYIHDSLQLAKQANQDKKVTDDIKKVEDDKQEVTKADSDLQSAIDKFDRDNS